MAPTPNTNPVIVVHGVQGSWLKDEYPVDYQRSILWTGVLHRNFKALHLHPSDATVDADPRRLVRPHQAVPMIYESLVAEIREELEQSHPYVYAFTYDWRKDNRIAAAELGQFVQRVLHIAGVHEKARKSPRRRPTRVTLIGHSMGGLVIKWYVTKVLGPTRAARHIDKIITIATPYRGSLKAVEALLPGARNLFGFENKKSMRHAARTMPGVYQLLPSWPGAVARLDDERPLDIFDPRSWQRNLVDTLKERFNGLRFFRNMLTDARDFISAVGRPWPEALRRRVYTAFGVNTRTWWQVPVDTAEENFFRFDQVKYGGHVERNRKRFDTLTKNTDTAAKGAGTVTNVYGTGPKGNGVNATPDNPYREGDGTVPVVSSVRKEIHPSHCRRDVTGLRDTFIGHHANMPNHGGIQDWLLGVLKFNVHSARAFESPL